LDISILRFRNGEGTLKAKQTAYKFGNVPTLEMEFSALKN
jgi:hypothetical protein